MLNTVNTHFTVGRTPVPGRLIPHNWNIPENPAPMKVKKIIILRCAEVWSRQEGGEPQE